MSDVFIVGGSGKVARRLIAQLAGRGHSVRALHRHPEQATELQALGATPVIGSLTELSQADLTGLMNGAEVVVFSAGAGGRGGPENTRAIDGRGLELAVEAAKQAGIRRFIVVSAFPEALRDQPRSKGFENYIRVKKLADAHLVASGLDWVILRPGTLSDDPGTGLVRAGAAIPYGHVPREDVATALVELIEQGASRVIVELTSGDDPVDRAVAQALAR